MKQGLPENHGLTAFIMNSEELLPKVEKSAVLTDIQYEALAAGISRGESVLISAPTSTGKTLIGWWAITSAIENGGRAVYLVSHRALARQKFEEAQRLFLSGPLLNDRTAIVCATGDSVEDASGRKTSAPMGATVLVATYEKFLGCLSVGGPPRDLSDTSFICDEIQLVGDDTRGQNVELLLTLLRRSGWRQFVGLSAVLSERNANELADWLEIQLVRNPTREKALRIECRTSGQVQQVSVAPGIERAMETISGSRPLDINQIVRELTTKVGLSPVIAFCMKVDDTYDFCGQWIAGKSESQQIAPPAGLELDPALRRALTRRAAFHNAELSEDERLFVEQLIASGQVDVVYATGTLAAGVNFPLGSAVFTAWKRWNSERKRREPIGRAEFQNMAGRVGRMGQATDEGLVILTAESVTDMRVAAALMDLGAQDELGQGIGPEDFGPLTLQLFAGKLCSNSADCFDLLSSTLSASREANRNSRGVSHWQGKLDGQIGRLVQTGCLIQTRTHTTVTAFGLAVARTGLKPETALYFIDGLIKSGVELLKMLSGREDELLFILSHAALSSPEYTFEGGQPTRHVNWRVGQNGAVANDYARRLDALLWDRPWIANPSAANGALLVAQWGAGQPRSIIEKLVGSVRLGTIEATAREVAWILTGVAEIISEVTSPTLADESKPDALRGNSPQVDAVRQLARSLRRQSVRAASGLPSDVAWMTTLDLKGLRRRLTRSQILSLRKQGFIRPHDLMNGGSDADTRRRIALDATEDASLANQARAAARDWKIEEREYYKRVHLKRAAKVGAESVVHALHTAKENELESAFEAAMSLVSIIFERLDGPGKQAHPDFLITIENYSPIIVEIKSKLKPTDLVNFNSATEVLGASELIGMRDRFCVTVCSPGVDPSVPGSIENCARLCVVDICDLAEAILRLREGALTRDGFYNWLSTPGIALMADLPAPVTHTARASE